MTSITLENVNKVYANGFQAVHDLSFAIDDGQFTVLVGPSGCGKSTLLRMIAGLEDISSGAITLGERVINTIDPADRDIAMVFQNYALYPHMSVYNNLAYGLKNRKVAKADIEARVQEAARILEISDYLDRKPRQLSGGQRQRVAMGRAIVRKPQAFLFDEPLSNLDAKLRVQMRIEIKRLQQDLGTTSVYVTHDQMEAMTMADQLVVMNKGRIEQIGAPMDLYDRPQSTFVAAFIGSPSMNLIDLTACADGYGLAADAHPLVRLGGGEETITLGIRPEHLHIVDAAEGMPSAGETAFQTRLSVSVIEPVGAESYVHGHILDGEQALPQRIALRVPGRMALMPGAVVRVVAARENLHCFSTTTGQRIADGGVA